jgi:hypothetical protein
MHVLTAETSMVAPVSVASDSLTFHHSKINCFLIHEYWGEIASEIGFMHAIIHAPVLLDCLRKSPALWDFM